MRYIVFIFALVCSMSISSQKHLDFRGIPIDGTISNFTKKMVGKGYTVDSASKRTPKGKRFFVDSSWDVDEIEKYIVVSYDAKTNNVYSMTMVYEFPEEFVNESFKFFSAWKKELERKYEATNDSCGKAFFENQDGLPLYGVDICNEQCEQIGSIAARIDYEPMIYSKIVVFIDYIDFKNAQKYFKPDVNKSDIQIQKTYEKTFKIRGG